MNSRDWALDLWDAGFQVVIVPIKGKTPKVPWKTYQKERLPRSAVETWFAHGEHNIALITGAISGVVVVDGDSPEACAYIEATCGVTPMVVVTRKGRHYYYRHPGARVPNAVRVVDDPPVDLRGDGGLVIGPGSIHETGHVYHLAEGADLTPPPDLPLFDVSWFPRAETAPETTWVRPVLHFNHPNQKDAYTQAQSYVSAIPGAPEGKRNHSGYVMACRLARGFNLPDDQALDLLMAWASRCTPPMDAEEAGELIQHARAYGTGEFGAMLARKATDHGGVVSYGWLS